MPAIPWIARGEWPADQQCVVMASRLPLRHYRSTPAFLRRTLSICRQLGRAEGLLGYALNAQLLRKRFWTVSAWRDRDALGAFNHADPHRSSVRAIRPAIAPTTFVTWTCSAAELPIRWAEVRRRIHEAEAERDPAV